MTAIDLAGWLAAALTLFTFVCRDMHRLRLLAICANLAFITYGACAGLLPVLTLHMMLAPVNAWRLRELCRQPDAGRAEEPIEAGRTGPRRACSSPADVSGAPAAPWRSRRCAAFTSQHAKARPRSRTQRLSIA